MNSITTELLPQYDRSKSFYKKAFILDDGKIKRLQSYDTIVGYIENNGRAVIKGTYSKTTLRHITEFLKQHGFKAESSKQIMADYKEVVN